MKKVTDLFNINKTQEQLTFPNICISGPDNRLFLDALLIADNNDAFSKKAHEVLTDFFHTVFKLVREDKIKELRSILDNSRENNSFRLGKSQIIKGVYSNGRGCGADMLIRLLTRVEHRRLIDNGIIQDPMGIILYIKDFSEDRMSDLIASVIFEQLNRFTVEQALKYNPNASFEKREGYRWDTGVHDWVKFEFEQLQDLNGADLSLVPKQIVTDKYRYNPDQYMMAHLIQHEQEIELDIAQETDPDAVKRNKKVIRDEKKSEMGNLSTKEFLIQYTLLYPTKDFIADYRESVKKRYNGGLSDSEITSVINRPYIEYTA